MGHPDKNQIYYFDPERGEEVSIEESYLKGLEDGRAEKQEEIEMYRIALMAIRDLPMIEQLSPRVYKIATKSLRGGGVRTRRG